MFVHDDAIKYCRLMCLEKHKNRLRAPATWARVRRDAASGEECVGWRGDRKHALNWDVDLSPSD